MRILSAIIMVFLCQSLSAQELFVYTEPASNMSAKSIGIRMNNYLMQENTSRNYNYHLLPEVMWGISKSFMVHAEGFLSNRNGDITAEGASLYVKYRAYSQDEVHSHFRLAFYGRGSYNNADVHQPAIDFFGHNSGYEGGIIATRLVHKLALSGSAAYLHATDNGGGNKFVNTQNRDAVSWSFSAGKLMLPKEYVNYNQTNMNLMLEVLGQTNLSTSHSYLDLAPSIQFIFLSTMRLDLGYRFPLINDLTRTTEKGFLLRMEYNFFNVYK